MYGPTSIRLCTRCMRLPRCSIISLAPTAKNARLYIPETTGHQMFQLYSLTSKCFNLTIKIKYVFEKFSPLDNKNITNHYSYHSRNAFSPHIIQSNIDVKMSVISIRYSHQNYTPRSASRSTCRYRSRKNL